MRTLSKKKRRLDVVAGARQVADVAAARRQLERHRVGARRGLQELERQVIVAHLDALLVEALAVDLHARPERRGRSPGCRSRLRAKHNK